MANIRDAIFNTFGQERLPNLSHNASAQAIIEWKQNPLVAQCYQELFVPDEDGIFISTRIARNAFNETGVPELTNDHLALCLTVCDIVLNPDSSGIVCSDREVRKRMKHYLVSIRCKSIYIHLYTY